MQSRSGKGARRQGKYFLTGTLWSVSSVVWQVLDSFAKLFKVARNDEAKVRSQGSKPRFETKVRPERAVAGLFLDRPCYDFAFRFDDFS
jgi:hypothetical protein